MKIGIIGSRDSTEIILSTLENCYDIDFISFTQEEANDFSEIITHLPNDLDGLIATGIGVYYKIIEFSKFNFPIHYFKRGSSGLIKAFFEAQKDNNINQKKILIDIINRNILEDIISDYDINYNSLTYFAPNPEKSEADYLKEYLELFYSNQIEVIFTSFAYIYTLLTKIGIPVYRISATATDIKNDFNHYLNQLQLSKAAAKTILIQKFIVVYNDLNIVTNYLNSYAKTIEGILLEECNEFMIISNKGCYSDNICISRAKDLTDKIISSQSTDAILVGLGTGDSVQKAIQNSNIALDHCKKDTNILFYDGVTFKKHTDNSNYSYLYLTETQISTISELTDLNPTYIQQIDIYIKENNENEFTSEKLSEILHITKRTANRILNKLESSGFIIDSKKDSPSVGRPKMIYTIQF